MRFPRSDEIKSSHAAEQGDWWGQEVWASLQGHSGPFLFMGGEPPAFPLPALSLPGGLSTGIPLPGDPWWSLLRHLDRGPWAKQLIAAHWPVPLITQALRFLEDTGAPEEPPVEEDVAYFRNILPNLLSQLLAEKIISRAPLVVDLGEGDQWGPLSREVLGRMLERQDIPAVFLVRSRTTLDSQPLVDPRRVDNRQIRWEAGAFLIPEDEDSFSTQDAGSWLDKLEGGLALGCTAEVLELANHPGVRLAGEQEIRLLQAQAQALLQREKTEEALRPAQISLSRSDTAGGVHLREVSYMILAKIFLKRGDGPGALRMAQAAKALPISTQARMLSRRLLEFQILHGTVSWQSRSSQELEAILLPLLKDLEEAGWVQSWTYLASQASLVLHVNNESVTAGIETLIQRAVAQSKNQRNHFRLAQSYQTWGILLQEKKNYREARRAYLKSYNLRKILGGEAEIAGLEIGLGYFHTSIGRYRESRRYLDRALKRLTGTNAFREVGAALYNLGVNAYFSGHGDEATEALYQGLEVMNQAGILHLPFTHRSDFHGVLGLSHLSEGRRAAAWDQLSKARSLIPTPGTLNLLLPLALQGLLSQDDRVLESIRTRLLANPEPQRHIYMDLLLRWAIKCKSRGDDQKATALLEEGNLWLQGRDIFPWHQEIFSQKQALETLVGEPDWPTLRLPDLRPTLQMVEQDRHLRNLSRQFHLTRFLNGVHHMTSNPGAGPPLPQEFLQHLFQYFPLKHAWLLFLPNQGERIFESRTAQFLEALPLTWKDLWHPDEWPGTGSGDGENTPWKGVFHPGERGFWVPLEGGQGGQGLLLGILNGDFDLDSEQMQALALGGHQAVLALELAGAWEMLAQAAHKDSLTGLWNRRSLPAQFSTMVSRREPKHQELLSLLYLDLDNFKDVNDLYGHGEGDKVLVWFSGALQSLIRAGDFAVRVGGDEFVVFLPGEGGEGAQSLASRIVGLFRDLPPDLDFLDSGKNQALGCSVGIYCGSVTESSDLDHWLSRADKALYVAKAQGKNRWALYEGA